MNVGHLRRALQGLPDYLPVRVGVELEEAGVVEIRANKNAGAGGAARYVFVGDDPTEIDDGSETEEVAADDAAQTDLAGADPVDAVTEEIDLDEESDLETDEDGDVNDPDGDAD